MGSRSSGRVAQQSSAAALSRQRCGMHSDAARSTCACTATATSDNVARFSDSSLEEFAIAVIADLHMQPKDDVLFQAAAQQIAAAMRGLSSEALMPGARVVQLGDVGGYDDKPGSVESFEKAVRWLDGIGAPRLLVTGNHDLEGIAYESDEDNLAAWHQAVGQHHYWRTRVGVLECIGLSTTRYRSNKSSVHEVFIDDEQIKWLRQQLADIDPATPVAIFSHAPPMGSGLKALPKVHVKNRCAWLNHSSNPRVFIEMVKRHRNVRLWFSGHFHLSHDYARSISVVGQCAFVTSNVIGSYNRDGLRQSRLLKGDAHGFQVLTVDHDSGALRVDLEARWQPEAPLQPLPLAAPLDEEVMFDFVSSQHEWGDFEEPAASCPLPQLPAAAGTGTGSCASLFLRTGPMSAIALQGNILLEYDLPTGAPVGALSLDAAGCEVAVVDARGQPLGMDDVGDGAKVVAVELRRGGQLVDRVERNEDGCFFRIFQPNKWRIKQAERAAAAARAVPA